MTNFDHAQDPRLGQPTGVEAPGVQLVTTETLPEVAYRGQIVYLLDVDKFRVYDGIAWQNPTSDVAGGTQTFVQTTTPVADSPGDLWMNPSTGEMKVWNGTAWVGVQDPNAAAAAAQASAALAAALTAQGDVAAKTTIWYTTTLPALPSQDPQIGDYWLNTVTNQLYRFDVSTTAVISVQDVGIVNAINAAGTAQATADEKIQTYHTDTAPTGLAVTDIGDLWFDTSNNNQVSRWNGATWVVIGSVVDGTAFAQYVTLTDATITNRAIDPVTNQPTGAGIDIAPDGLFTYDDLGTTRTELPVDPLLPQVFRGDAEIDHLTVQTLTTLQETDVTQGAILTLQNGVAPPSARPSISITWNTKQHTDSNNWSERNGFATDGTYFYTAYQSPTNNRSIYIERWNRDGTRDAREADTYTAGIIRVHGLVCVGSFVYVLVELGTGSIMFTQYDTATLTWNNWHDLGSATTHLDGDGYGIAVGYDAAAGQFLLAQARFALGYKVLISRYTYSTNSFSGTTVSSTFVYQFNLSCIMFDSFDLGVSRYIFGNFGASNAIVMDTSGNEVNTEEWNNPSGGRQGMVWASYNGNYTRTSGSNQLTSVTGISGIKLGMPISGTGIPAGTTITAYNAGAGTLTLSANATTSGTSTYTIGPQFIMSDKTGLRYMFEASAGNRWTTAANGTWYTAYTWFNGSTQTSLSPITSFTMNRRARLTVNTPNPVAGVTGSKIYLAQGSSTPSRTALSMTLNGTQNIAPYSQLITNAVFTPTNNPTANGFGSGSPAVLQPDGGPTWAFYGDGTYTLPGYQNYTPVLTGTTTNPNIGATGTIAGEYMVAGDQVNYRITITLGGSGISAGSGGWLVTLPVTSGWGSLTPIGTGRVSSGGTDLARVALQNGSTRVQLNDNAGNRVNNATVSWSAGDVFQVTGTYRKA